MKKFEIPHSVLNATDKCPYDYSCLDTGKCEGADGCLEDHSCGEKNIIFLKDTKPPSSCPYHDNYDCQQVCLCPIKSYLHQQRINGEIIFKQCMRCKKTWKNCTDFLSDPSLTLHAYQISFEKLETGMFLFDHTCKTTLAIPAGDFAHLYDGPILKERAAGTDKCPEYCLQTYNFDPCPIKCECSYIREVLQIIKNWPKNKLNQK